MRRRWKVWVAGLALALLLALGFGAAVVGPEPGEAELAATRIKVGMSKDRALELSRPGECHLSDDEKAQVVIFHSGDRWPDEGDDPYPRRWRYAEGSTLSYTLDPAGRRPEEGRRGDAIVRNVLASGVPIVVVSIGAGL